MCLPHNEVKSKYDRFVIKICIVSGILVIFVQFYKWAVEWKMPGEKEMRCED